MQKRRARRPRPEVTALVVGLWMEACSGLLYAYSAYSAALKPRLGNSQEAVDAVGTAKDVGGYLMIVPGLCYDRLGPRACLVIGAVLSVLGYAVLAAFADGRADLGGLPGCAAVMLVAAFSGAWFDTAALVTSLQNYPEARGVVSGLLKSTVGLSSALFTGTYAAFAGTSQGAEPGLILVVGVVPAVVALAAAPRTVQVPPRAGRRSDGPLFAALAAVVLVLTGCILGQTLSGGASKGLAATILTFTLVAPPSVAAGVRRLTGDGEEEEEEEDEEEHDDERAAPAEVDVAEPLLGGEDGTSGGDVDTQPRLRGQKSASLGLGKAGLTVEFWLLFVASALGAGASLALINNLRQLVAALGGSEAATVQLVSLLSVANGVGRLALGTLGEWIVSRGANRAWTLLAAAATVGLALFATAACTSPAALFVPTLAVGFGFGAHWSFLPAACADLFGAENVGGIYGGLSTAPMFGSLALATLLTGSVADAHPTPCSGPQCFRAAWLGCAAACALECVCALVLVARTRHMYARAR